MHFCIDLIIRNRIGRRNTLCRYVFISDKKMQIAQRVASMMQKLGWSEGELGRRSGVPQPTVHRILNGESQSPRQNNVEKIAKALGVTSSWLWSGTNVEEPSGVYVTQQSHDENAQQGPQILGRVPLISWVRAGDLCEAIDLFQPGDADEWLDCPMPHGPNAFCLKVVGDSMFPDYREGEIILVEPRLSAQHGDDVVVRTPEGKTTFKRLQITPDGTHLLAVNKEYPNRIIEVPDDTHICGVVTASWMNRRRS